MPARMDQAQFRGRLRGLRLTICTACNVVFDLIERAPKLLLCGHFFCVMCLRSMTRGDYVLCFTCGRQTPAPRDLAWLPTYTAALPPRSVPAAIHEPVAGSRRPPVRLSAFPVSTNCAREARGNPQVLGRPSIIRSINEAGFRGNPPRSALSVYGEQYPREIEMPFVPYSDRELLCGLELPHGAPNASSGDEAAANTSGSNGGDRTSRHAYTPPSTIMRTPQLSPRAEKEGHSAVFLEMNGLRSITSEALFDPEIVRITQTMKDLIHSLEITSAIYHNHERWVSSWFIQDETNNLHQLIPDSHQIPFSFLNTIRQLREFLTELQRVGGSTAIFHFCLFLMYQLHEDFVERIRNSEFSQVNNVDPVPTLPLDFVDLNGNNLKSPADAQTQTEWWDILASSESQGSLRSISDGSEGEAVGGGTVSRKPKVHSANHDEPNPVNAVSLPFNLSRSDIANIYFMDFEIPGHRPGRVVVETFPAVAPLMSANFAVLCSGTGMVSYKGCRVFQCWNGQSIISGDTETNTGNGGKSILNDEFFEPDETSIPPVRGTIGMRRLARNPASHKGKVSSQFRILLTTQSKITGLFGHVVSGIEVVDAISQLDDGRGNPRRKVFISNCGKLEF